MVAAATPLVCFSSEPVIHRCPLPDGTFAFQETPCAQTLTDSDIASSEEQQSAAPTDDFFDFVNPFDQTDEEIPQPQQSTRRVITADRTECEKTTRDAIDAIDAEMRNGYSKEEGKKYLADLLELTRELRACKTL